jgi:hypothetical protein
MAATNTFGLGADAMYAGRNQLDAATLDRFYVVRVDYDENLDRQLCGLPPITRAEWTPDLDVTPADVAHIGRWTLDVREAVARAGMRRVFSPRATQKAVAALQAGIPAPEVKRDLLAGWSRDELSKLGNLATA